MIIMTCGPIGFETAEKLYNENRDYLEERFPEYFLRQFKRVRDEKVSANDLLEFLRSCDPKGGAGDVSSDTTGDNTGSNAAVSENITAMISDRIYICEIKKGGLFAALWHLGECLDTGLEVWLDRIPVRQEITEILELFGESPYECSSEGSFVVAADEDKLNAAISKMRFSLTGRTTHEKARIIRAKEFTRYLTPPSRQQKDIEDRETGFAK